MGDVHDSDKETTKQNWLWTTAKRGVKAWEFDTIRVIIYNPRHHRFETAFVERDLQGFYPVEVTASTGNKATFAYIEQDEDGRYFRKSYSFNGHVAQFLSREVCPSPDPSAVKSEPLVVVLAESRIPKAWYEKAFAPVQREWRRWFN